MSLPPFCDACATYHPVDAGCVTPRTNRLASLKPLRGPRKTAHDYEQRIGWVALLVLAGIAVLSLGWCQ